MAILDDNNNYIDPASVSSWAAAKRYGGMAAIITIVIGLIAYLTGLTDFEAIARGEGGAIGMILNVINYAIWIGAIVMAVKFVRDEQLGGYISFGKAFGVGFLTSLILGVISAIWTYVLFAFIEPGAHEVMLEAAMENMPEDQAEAAGGMMELMMSPIAMSFWVILGALILGAIFSLIVAAIMKKEAPAV